VNQSERAESIFKLVSIGFLGEQKVYINVSKEEAISRYNAENPNYTVEGQSLMVREFQVTNGEFTVYDMWV
jgi:hypothetical protein